MSFWDGKKVLVTGGAGFVGSHLVEYLLEAGEGVKVTVADNLSSGAPRNLSEVEGRIRLERADLTDAADCARVCAGQDVVMHLAARVGGLGYNIKHPATIFRQNIRMTSHILEESQKAGIERFLMVSTACVYPRHCKVPTPESEGFEGWPEPTNEGYGWSKRMGEFETMMMGKEFGMRAAIARPYNTYGPRDHFDPNVSHVIPALIRRVCDGEDPLKVWGDGSATRAFLYVEDYVRGLLEVTERYAECDPVNLGTDEEVSVRELVGMILELAGSKAEVEYDASKPSGQPRRNCDTSKAREKVGFEAKVSLREGLRRTIEWYRANRELSR